MLKGSYDSYDEKVNWLIGGDMLHQGTVHNLVIFFESLFVQMYETSYVNHLQAFKTPRPPIYDWKNHREYNMPVSNSISQTLLGQNKYVRPHMKRYCSCQLKYGYINYFICTDKSERFEANLRFFNRNILHFGNGYLSNINSCITDEEIKSIYDYFKSDINETRKVNWKYALSDCIPTFDEYPETNNANKQMYCPLHEDIDTKSLDISWATNQWHCFGRKGSCGAGHLPTLIMKVTKKPWHELKPKYLTDEIKQVNTNPPQSLSEEPVGLIDTEPLNESHPLVTEHGFDLEFLNSWGVKTAPGFEFGNYAMPYIVNGKVIAYAVRFSVEEAKRKDRKFHISKGFSNSKYLLGVHRIEHNPKLLLVVEGGKDQMRLDSFGYKSVATFGAGMSNHQFELIKEINPQEICVVFDNDPSGMSANYRAISELIKAKLNVSTIVFEDKDNDFGDIKDKPIVDKYIPNRINIYNAP